jgi:hypothetical protein
MKKMKGLVFVNSLKTMKIPLTSMDIFQGLSLTL